MNNKIIWSVVIVIVFVIGIFFITRPKTQPALTSVPTDYTIGWTTFSDPAQGITFKYPETIPTTYITLVAWPPKVQVVNGSFVCTNGGEAIIPNGQTTTQTINGHEYCVTTLAQGAAGSTYTEYGYVTKIQNKFISFGFTLRATQCANYPDPQKTACDTERASFSINPIIDQIIQTTHFSS